MNNMNPYNREESLRERLNAFLSQRFDIPALDYYSRLNTQAFLGLKSVLADINNILTLKVSLAFAEWISARLDLDSEARQALKRIVLRAKPNANGFDVWLGYPIAFVAEVKCNVPINGGSIYGSAQRHGIEKDIAALLQGKSKASINSQSCPKFFAFLDLPEIRNANAHLLRVSKTCKEKLVFVSENTEFDRLDIVYGVYVAPEP